METGTFFLKYIMEGQRNPYNTAGNTIQEVNL
jgi:hypothetical protein